MISSISRALGIWDAWSQICLLSWQLSMTIGVDNTSQIWEQASVVIGSEDVPLCVGVALLGTDLESADLRSVYRELGILLQTSQDV
jgi:hypothetical protein